MVLLLPENQKRKTNDCQDRQVARSLLEREVYTQTQHSRVMIGIKLRRESHWGREKVPPPSLEVGTCSVVPLGEALIDQWKWIGTEQVKLLGWQSIGEDTEMVPTEQETSCQILPDSGLYIRHHVEYMTLLSSTFIPQAPSVATEYHPGLTIHAIQPQT